MATPPQPQNVLARLVADAQASSGAQYVRDDTLTDAERSVCRAFLHPVRGHRRAVLWPVNDLLDPD